MGENTLALAQEFAKFLQSDPEIAASKSRENSVYFDVFGYFMVSSGVLEFVRAHDISFFCMTTSL